MKKSSWEFNRSKLQDIEFLFLTLSRVISVFAGIIILRFAIQNLEFKIFVFMQMQLALLSMIIWIADFGSLSHATILFGKNDFLRAKKVLSTRMQSLFIVLIFYIIVLQFFEVNHSSSVFVVALFFDLYTDGLNGWRQIASSKKYSFVSLPIKKSFQLLLLSVFSLEFNKISIFYFSMSLLIPSLAICVFDFLYSKLDISKFEFKFLWESRQIWFQSGGTVIAGLDIPLMNFAGGAQAIPIYSVARKVSNALGVFGSTLVPHSMIDSAESDLSLGMPIRRILRTTALVSGICVISLLSSKFLLQNIFEIAVNTSNLCVFVMAILCVPLGVLTANLNAILIARNFLRAASQATYSSTAIYLASITTGCISGNVYFGVIAAIFLNGISELAIQFFYLRKLLIAERRIEQ